ncbi:MAG: hypothetical protein CMJ58_13790 [Planctomycetaceae bacterium]|nr:hypothetical protein [Planctomycetaceae bacterium]
MKFNTLFLLQATVVTALCCLPIALDREQGFVITAFALPALLGWLATTQARREGPFEIAFRELPDSVVEIRATGGRQAQLLARSRIFIAGCCLSIACGFPMLHQVDPEPPLMWGPIVAAFAVWAVVMIGYSSRLTLRTDQRLFVGEFLVFGLPCWRQRRWQIEEGDLIAVLVMNVWLYSGSSEFSSMHTICVQRDERQYPIAAGLFQAPDPEPMMETAATRIAAWVELPYVGYETAGETDTVPPAEIATDE